MIELTRPMLATAAKKEDWPRLRFPTLASPKIDGIRALCKFDAATRRPLLVSRTLKPIVNVHTQALFARPEFMGLDGELVVGEPTDKNLMQQTSSGVMSQDGTPNTRWFVFDKWDVDGQYVTRAADAKGICKMMGGQTVEWVPHVMLKNLDDMLALEEKWVNQGFEGMMLRDPYSPYKQNRSTLREGYLLKIKRFEDSEAIILDFKELQTNTNEATEDERGYTKRSTHQAGKIGAGVLGAFTVRDCETGVEFDLGTGFTAEQRKNLWEGRKYLVGKIVTYKHFAVGVVDSPRFPIFKAFRKD